MVAGAAADGKTFEQLQFNDQHPDTNPVTGEPLDPVPFANTSQGFSVDLRGTPLPTLNLRRVFVLTGPGTCSASESIINSLRGVDVEVIQIGSTTCGKPYGFYPADNCGTTYFSIQFRGVNAKGFGDYADGFSPQNTAGIAGVALPGCSVADDFTHPLGDAARSAARRGTALPFLRHLRQSAERLCSADGARRRGRCPQPTAMSTSRRGTRTAFSQPPRTDFRCSDQPGALDGVIAVDELDAEPLRLRIHHQGIPRRQAVEGIAPRLLVEVRARHLEGRVARVERLLRELAHDAFPQAREQHQVPRPQQPQRLSQLGVDPRRESW